MNKDKKIRKLGYLINKYNMYHIPNELTLIEYLDGTINCVFPFKGQRKIQDIKNIVIELKIDKKEYLEIYSNSLKNHSKFDVNLNTIKETRDNKGVYIGNGGSNRNKIRYPKKKRSKRVWKVFYEMFPYAAKIDDYWKGKSKKMK